MSPRIISFTSITLFSRTHNILWNISSFSAHVRTISQYMCQFHKPLLWIWIMLCGKTLQLQSNKGQSSRDFTPGITFSYFTVNPNPKPFFEEPPLFLFLFFSYEVNRIVFLDVHIALTCISDSIWSANTHRPPSYYHTAGNRHHNIVMSQSSVSPVSSHYTRIQLLKNKNNKHKREQKKTQIRNIQ